MIKKCPYCAEEIQDKAIKCKHCGEWLPEREESLKKEKEEEELQEKIELEIKEKERNKRKTEIKNKNLKLNRNRFLNEKRKYRKIYEGVKSLTFEYVGPSKDKIHDLHPITSTLCHVFDSEFGLNHIPSHRGYVLGSYFDRVLTDSARDGNKNKVKTLFDKKGGVKSITYTESNGLKWDLNFRYDQSNTYINHHQLFIDNQLRFDTSEEKIQSPGSFKGWNNWNPSNDFWENVVEKLKDFNLSGGFVFVGRVKNDNFSPTNYTRNLVYLDSAFNSIIFLKKKLDSDYNDTNEFTADYNLDIRYSSQGISSAENAFKHESNINGPGDSVRYYEYDHQDNLVKSYNMYDKSWDNKGIGDITETSYDRNYFRSRIKHKSPTGFLLASDHDIKINRDKKNRIQSVDYEQSKKGIIFTKRQSCSLKVAYEE